MFLNNSLSFSFFKGSGLKNSGIPQNFGLFSVKDIECFYTKF